MPAPETPIRIKIGGSQQQLDAMIADTTVPILATVSPRLDDEPSARVSCVGLVVAPGNELGFGLQQLPTGKVFKSGSFDIACLLSFYDDRLG